MTAWRTCSSLMGMRLAGDLERMKVKQRWQGVKVVSSNEGWKPSASWALQRLKWHLLQLMGETVSFPVFTWVPILLAQWVQPWTAKQVLPSPTLKLNPLSAGALGHRVEAKSSRLGLTREGGTQIRTASMSMWTSRASGPSVPQGNMCLLVRGAVPLLSSWKLLLRVLPWDLSSEFWLFVWGTLTAPKRFPPITSQPGWERKNKTHPPALLPS